MTVAHGSDFIQFVTAVLVTMNPVTNIPAFLGLTTGFTPRRRNRVAAIAALTGAGALIAAIVSGDSLLRFFGINVPCFQVSGGILLLMTAIAMLREKAPGGESESKTEPAEGDAVGVFPLGIPLLAGPGALCTAIIYSNQATTGMSREALIAGSLFAGVCVWVVLRLAERVSLWLGPTGTKVLSRLMGLILGALAIKFITDGLTHLLPGLSGN
jgi:multiple antibiotic resistance protein